MIRRYGETPQMDRRYQIRRGVYAILPYGDALLLTHQAEPEPEFQLPGGGIDSGEHPITALHREVMEETGWKIARPRHIGAFRRFVFMPEYDLWAEKLCLVYRADPVLRLGDPTEARRTFKIPEMNVGIHDGDIRLAERETKQAKAA